MAMAKRLTISRGGQVSVPAAVRKRWRTNTVVAEDRGDHLVLRPTPDDPIEAARGAFKEYFRDGPSVAEDLEAYKQEEIEAEEGKWRRHYGEDLPTERN
jgi:bifunctional DNA-binding transcriptional regulator/antitoxin component of YhaV-PrlF toxin-antitoxin module